MRVSPVGRRRSARWLWRRRRRLAVEKTVTQFLTGSVIKPAWCWNESRAILRLLNGIKLAPHGGKCQEVATVRLLRQLRRKGIVR